MNIQVTDKVWHGGPISRDLFKELQASFFGRAQKIAADARQLCHYGSEEKRPVYKGKMVGHLRDTIRARPGRYGRLKAVVHGLAAGEYETAQPVAYTFAGNRRAGVYWQYFLEYGTYDKDAHPFMRPAANKNFNPALAEAEHAAQRAINKKRREAKRR